MLTRLFKKKSKESKLLILGHDLKFLTPVIEHFKDGNVFKVEEFTYKGHTIPDKAALLKMLPDYDIVFCEWGLGNIRFMSKNILPRQKLIVRIHLQEFSTNFLRETKWENVDAMIFISEFQFERFKTLFPQFADKCRLIYNVIDCGRLDREKDADSRFTLGMMGILPARKWPHLGIEILHELKKHDSRFRLSIKSKRPEELDWLWRRPEERAYYNKFYNDIKNLGLTDSVIFEPHGDDVPEWFQKIGFILSTSEFEGSHQSVAEGMASGSVPVIRNWDGSVPLYPEVFNFNKVGEAVNIILSHLDEQVFQMESENVREYAWERFDQSVILPEYDRLIDILIK